jgi:Putative Actinobacterial Holin-X, holin superfamily III
VAYAGLLAILAGVIVLVGQIIPVWLSALLVGLVVAAVGYFLVKKGLDALKREDIAPRQTIQTLKEDGQWIKDQTK